MTNMLIADIGGSNTRLAIVDSGGRPQHVHAFANDSVQSLETAIGSYLERFDRLAGRPAAAVFAVAGPGTGRRIALTNRDWEIDLDAIENQFGFRFAHALNDFEALAWALPSLGPDQLRVLGPELPSDRDVMAVIGPGTGLGVAALIPHQDSWIALSTEAGHVSFGPAARDEWPVFARMAEDVELLSGEAVISGPGLERLHRALHPDRPAMPAHAIEAAAAAGEADAQATVALFARLLGRFAGDIALSFKAFGGLFIAGGVAAKLAHSIDGAIFREAFVAHPPHRHLLEATPTFLVTQDEPGLFGCAAYAARLAGNT